MLWGEAIGLTRDEMWNGELSPVTTAFKGYLTEICRRSFLEGVSALMMAGEAQAPGNFDRVAKALKKRFDLSDEAVAFWTVHDVADEDHSGTGRELMEQFAQTQEQRHLVVETVEEYFAGSGRLAPRYLRAHASARHSRSWFAPSEPGVFACSSVSDA